jgi:hypothetical protein
MNVSEGERMGQLIDPVGNSRPSSAHRGRWKLVAAELLLPSGACMIGAAAERGGWWAVLGCVCLYFVPGLTADYVLERIRER